jgi:dienelactone hydrolase
VLLAGRGVLSLLTDGPVARPGYQPDRTPMNEWQFDDLVHAVVDMRRGVDLLLSRGADPKRIGYVGHSYNATVGAILSGVDRRFAAFVLMAGGLWDEVDLKTKPYLAYRERVGPEKWDAFAAAHSWSDPGRYLSRAAPAAVLMQFAAQEDFLTPDLARQYAANVSEPKQLKTYEAPHALNAEARRDRIAFLAERLGFEKPSPEAIAKVPELPQPPQPKP